MNILYPHGDSTSEAKTKITFWSVLKPIFYVLSLLAKDSSNENSDMIGDKIYLEHGPR